MNFKRKQREKEKKNFYFILIRINFCIKKYLRKFKDNHKK